MCKVITIINKDKTEEAIQKINQFLELNIPVLQERDGFAVLKDDKAEYFVREKDYNNMFEHIKNEGSEIEIIHTRQATAGEKGRAGLHLQKIAGWYFAHNGTTSIETKIKSDSWFFFHNLLKKGLSKKNIEKAIKKYDFLGRGFLYQPRTKQLIIFMNQKIHLTALTSQCIAITTYTPILISKENVSILGFRFVEKTKIDYLFKDEIDDRFLTFENGILKSLEKLKYSYSYSYNRRWYQETFSEKGKIKNYYFNKHNYNDK